MIYLYLCLGQEQYRVNDHEKESEVKKYYDGLKENFTTLNSDIILVKGRDHYSGKDLVVLELLHQYLDDNYTVDYLTLIQKTILCTLQMSLVTIF